MFSIVQTSLAESARESTPSLKIIEARVSENRSTFSRISNELEEARKKNDVRRVNCLLLKLNLVKGLVKASDKAMLVLLQAAGAKDQATAASYSNRVMMYGKSVDELGKSASECSGDVSTPEGTTLVYIRPEEPDFISTYTSPWGARDDIGGVGSTYPVVPPGTPYR